MKGKIHSFETFGTLDGPGIRFVLFLKGCPLRCLYCHNPDTWTMDNSLNYDVDEVLSIIKKYKNYYHNGGGVTISGGEPLLQLDFVISLLRKCKEEGFHTAIDTSGVLFNENEIAKFDELCDVCDLFLLDIKHIDSRKHQILTGLGNENVLNFARYLNSKKKEIWIRHVLVNNYTSNEDDLKELHKFINKLEMVSKIDVLPYHTLGVYKYDKLGIEYPLDEKALVNEEQIQSAKNILKKE